MNKMIKKLRKLFAGIACLLLLTGCGESTVAASVSGSVKNAETIASELLQVFEGVDMEQQDAATVKKLLNIDDDTGTDVIAYFGKGNPDDILIVLGSKDSDEAMKANDALNYYLDSQKSSASLYSKEQLEQLDNAYVSTKDVFSVMIVAEDGTAAKKAAAAALK